MVMNPIRSLRCTFLLACTTFNIDFLNYLVTNMVSKRKILHRQELQERLCNTTYRNASVIPRGPNVY